MANRLTKGKAYVGAIGFTGGATIKRAHTGTATLDPASINATTRGSATFTVAGAAVGDIVIVSPPAALEDDLIFCGATVTGANTVSVYLYNPTAGPIDAASAGWAYLVLDVT